jgi:negative regulator of sigma E activity
MRLIDHEAPVAYCLPGTTRSVTVLSAGLIDLLDEEQLRAVISHENAHATQRHHLVLMAFRAWRASLPWFPIATRALVAVTTLVEMLADDRARRDVSDETLARSIALVASASGERPASGPLSVGEASRNALAADGESAHRRIQRLIDRSPPLSVRSRVFAAACGFALLAVPTALVLAPMFS